MARVQVVSEDGQVTLDIAEDDEGTAEGICRSCGAHVGDPYSYVDTIVAAGIHVDQCAARS